MAERSTLRIDMEVLGVEYGQWCEDCLLPSAGIVTIAMSHSFGPRGLGGPGVFQAKVCGDCGKHDRL